MATKEQTGYWGAPTSSVDWCEDNYVWSYYIAEWWNSWSNVPPLMLALYAMHTSRRAYAGTEQPLTIRIAYAVPLFIFTGSFAFHSTLTYYGQMLDELPMMYGTLYFHYISLRHKPMMKWVLGFFAVALTAAMAVFRHAPLPFQFAYGALTVALIARSILFHRGHEDVSKTRLLQLGAVLYATAFALWVADQTFCPTVKPLHFHALWHLLSGAGTFVWIQFACAHELSLSKQGIHVRKIAAVLPYITHARHA
ncbi:alkaline phytoceramidase family protein [Achlya hypogyna]|uniref:Alkaline phytoceramidase family protein n=1 Tax=Achlya hypogyna TaxID=1202772 RepID=A0A1V9YZW3_ACHHY|nr:alkaline phytoceramidase family protein [Achlya hypogyna]